MKKQPEQKIKRKNKAKIFKTKIAKCCPTCVHYSWKPDNDKCSLDNWDHGWTVYCDKYRLSSEYV